MSKAEAIRQGAVFTTVCAKTAGDGIPHDFVQYNDVLTPAQLKKQPWLQQYLRPEFTLEFYYVKRDPLRWNERLRVCPSIPLAA